MRLSRRETLLGAAALALTAPTVGLAAAETWLAELERRRGGRLGVFALDTGSGRSLAWRADERFLMCSTFKTLAVAATLKRVETGRERLDRPVTYGRADLLDYAPVTTAHVKDGAMSVQALCQAAIEVSDNTAANLLMKRLGGPQAVTRYARTLDDLVTRQDGWEPLANHVEGQRNTTSPRAMAGSVREVLLGQALKPGSRAMIERWLTAATPGINRIRAGLPPGWRAGDKAGTGQGHTNDVAIIRPPGRAPLIVAAYYEHAGGGLDGEGVLKQVGAMVAKWAVAT